MREIARLKTRSSLAPGQRIERGKSDFGVDRRHPNLNEALNYPDEVHTRAKGRILGCRAALSSSAADCLKRQFGHEPSFTEVAPCVPDIHGYDIGKGVLPHSLDLG